MVARQMFNSGKMVWIWRVRVFDGKMDRVHVKTIFDI